MHYWRLGGVGKTYIWQTELDAAKKANSVSLARYSYVSLFGINSLETFKLALFENLEFLMVESQSTIRKGLQSAKAFFSKAKRLNDIATVLPYVGQALSKAGPLYFSLVRNQIICVDDLERRGRGLDVKDVFGLISFLREQRACKIVLLLNSDALAESKSEFETYFEKVVDARVVFKPTAAEATKIALPQDEGLSSFLRSDCEKLNIANIRVIKKIERLALQIEPLLKKFAPEVLRSATHTVALFGWSKFQPTLAPPFEHFRISSMERYIDEKHNKKVPSTKELEWNQLLARYQFSHMDDLDKELLKFVDSGILDSRSVEARAAEMHQQIILQKQMGSYEQAWRPFHDSLDDNIDEVARSLIDGLKRNISVASLANLNASVKLLKELDRGREAKEVVDFFVANKEGGADFWNRSNAPFERGPFDPDVEAAIANQQSKNTKAFDPEVELLRAAQTYDADAIKRLAQVSVDEYYRMVKSKNGEEMRTLILSGLEFRRIANATPEMVEVVRRMEEALKRIGSESKLNAARIVRYGVVIDDSDKPGAH